MIEVELNGKKELCFMVKRGDANDIVIPIKSLVGIDYRRLSGMEDEGGELMKVMRETTLDNGNNALVQYQHLLVTVPKEVKKEVKVEQKVTEEKDAIFNDEDGKENKPRGRGRPKKD